MKYASQIPRETIARLEAMAAEDPVRFCQPHPCPGVYSCLLYTSDAADE